MTTQVSVIHLEYCPKCGREKVRFLHVCRGLSPRISHWKDGCPVCDDSCHRCVRPATTSPA